MGLVQAYESGTGGLFVEHDHKKKENESWHPTRDCNLEGKRLVSGPSAENPNQPHYICTIVDCRFHRFERDIKNVYEEFNIVVILTSLVDCY